MESFKKKLNIQPWLPGCTATDRHNNTLPHNLLLWCNINTMEFMMSELVREDLRDTSVEIVDIQWTYQTRQESETEG